MPYAVSEAPPVHILALTGRIMGSIERTGLERLFDDLLAAGPIRLVIDFSRTDFMDSTGMGLVVRGAKRLREAGGAVCLAGLPTHIKSLFLMTRLLGSVFLDFPDTEAARQHLAANVTHEEG